MSSSGPPGGVRPNHRIPRVLGILNILFAANLMGCGALLGLNLVMQPFFNRAMKDMVKQAEALEAAEREANLKEISEAEKAAKTDEEKAALKDRKTNIQVQGNKVTIALGGEADFRKIGLDDPRLVVAGWTDLLTGLALNLAMLAAGIGLLGRRRWAPALAMATAGLKIVRLLAFYGFLALAVVPTIAQKMGHFAIEQMERQQKLTGGRMPPGLNSEMLIMTYMVFFTVAAVGMIVFGSIYPLISLWLLNKRSVRAACSGTPEAGEPGDDW